MKKFVFTAALISALLCGCTGQPVQNSTNEETSSMFTIVEQTGAWVVVYHNETKVMYEVSFSSSNRGNFTLLVEADGTPMLWEGEC